MKVNRTVGTWHAKEIQLDYGLCWIAVLWPFRNRRVFINTFLQMLQHQRCSAVESALINKVYDIPHWQHFCWINSLRILIAFCSFFCRMLQILCCYSVWCWCFIKSTYIYIFHIIKVTAWDDDDSSEIETWEREEKRDFKSNQLNH